MSEGQRPHRDAVRAFWIWLLRREAARAAAALVGRPALAQDAVDDYLVVNRLAALNEDVLVNVFNQEGRRG